MTGVQTCALPIFALSVFGPERGWKDSRTLTAFGIGALLVLAFILQESRAVEPILPLHLFKNRTFSLTSALGFIIGAGMFGAIVMLPLYLQVVKENSATMAGLKLIPLMIGIVSLSIISGKQISKHGHYKRFPIIGALVMTSGLLLLSTLKRDTSYATLSLFAILVGAGLGLSMQTIVIALQNDVEFKDMGVATSANTFFRTLGGAFGTALFGTIFANRVANYLQENFAKLAQTQPQAMAGITPEQIKSITTNTSVINQFPPAVQQSVLDSFVSAFHVVFISAAPFTLTGFVLALFLVEKPLRTSQEHHAARKIGRAHV